MGDLWNNTWLFIFENDEMSFSYIFPINPLNHLILSEFVLIKDSSDVFYYKKQAFRMVKWFFLWY